VFLAKPLGLQFFGTPKAAGTSIRYALAMSLDMPVEPTTVNKLYPVSDYDPTCFSFAAVRNPWDRTVSLYKQLLYRRDPFRRVDKVAPFEEVRSFAEFVRIACDLSDLVANFHFRSQHGLCFVGHHLQHGWPSVDQLIWMHQLHAGWSRLQALASRPLAYLHQLNSTTHAPYQEYYDTELRELIAQRYADDIRAFGFRFEGEPDYLHLAHRYDLLRWLPGNGMCVEVGTHLGEYAQTILSICRPQRLYLVDSYAKLSPPGTYGSTYNYETVCAKFAAEPRVKIIREASTVAAARFPNDYFDWVYIDADHSQAQVTADLEAWWPKVKVGGYLAGHDYITWAPPEKAQPDIQVKAAVDQFLLDRGLQLAALTHEAVYKSWAIRKTIASTVRKYRRYRRPAVATVPAAPLVRLSDRQALLQWLPSGGVAAELGVHLGEYSQQILVHNQPRELHLVDHWADATGQLGDWQATANAAHVQRCFAADQRVQVHHADSVQAAQRFPDRYFDWVYVDAGHRFDQVTADLEAWWPKVKVGGYLVGHDYVNMAYIDVERAVNEFVARYGLSLCVLTSEPIYKSWGIQKHSGRPLCSRSGVPVEQPGYEEKLVYSYPLLGLQFWQVPKAACTSIRYALGVASGFELPADVMTIHRTQCDAAPQPGQRLFSFAVVRNPWGRLVSLHQQLQRDGVGFLHLNDDKPNPFRGDMPFVEFIRTIAQIPDHLANKHFRTQAGLLGVSGRPPLDCLIRFERLDVGWRRVQAFSTLPLPDLQLLNNTEHPPYQECYSDELRELVAQRYARDLVAFGFQFDDEDS
jgi:cephalosporin hydroxylase